MEYGAWRMGGNKATHGFGGLGSKSTFSIVKMSSAGSPQKYSGLSPGTLYSSLIVTWSLPSQEPEGVAETQSALAAARTRAVSCMAASGGASGNEEWLYELR
jgi:hypothetical protein